jgi:hypothetical protein
VTILFHSMHTSLAEDLESRIRRNDFDVIIPLLQSHFLAVWLFNTKMVLWDDVGDCVRTSRHFGALKVG